MERCNTAEALMDIPSAFDLALTRFITACVAGTGIMAPWALHHRFVVAASTPLTTETTTTVRGAGGAVRDVESILSSSDLGDVELLLIPCSASQRLPACMSHLHPDALAAVFGCVSGADASAREGLYLSHRFHGVSLAMLPTTLKDETSSDIFLWRSTTSPMVLGAVSERCAVAGLPEAVLKAGVEAVGRDVLPLLQQALSLRGTPYATALLTPTVGARITVDNAVRREVTESSGLDQPPIGWLFDGLGPVLMLELLVSLWRSCLDPSLGHLRLDPVGELNDVAALVERVLENIDNVMKRVRTTAADPITALTMCTQLIAHGEEALPDLALSRLLRLRITEGSRAAVLRGVGPVAVSRLLKAFDEPHTFGQEMSVGARALAKHHHRDETTSWWLPGGELKGTQTKKNALAITALAKVLHGCAWCNVHMLPHDIVTYEIRCAEGYGARWMIKAVSAAATAADDAAAPPADAVPVAVADPNSAVTYEVEFRGFLEPQDAEGHEKGWRH